MSDTFESEEQLEHWLAHMDDALAKLMARLPPEVRARLDYSPASLDVLERWSIDRYDGPEAIRPR